MLILVTLACLGPYDPYAHLLTTKEPDTASVTGDQPPYGLIFTYGDPDSGDVMIFEKAGMTDQEVLLDLLQDYMRVLPATVSDLSLEALRWQPGPEANNIAVTVWHVSRAFDLLKVRVLEDQDSEAEQWLAAGWAARTGYDPRGIGIGGFGNLSGYTQAEVAAVPILPVEELLAYFEEVANALYNCLQQMPAEALPQPPAGWSKPPYLSAYGWIRNFLLDAREHLGEIKAIKAMWERKGKGEEVGDE